MKKPFRFDTELLSIERLVELMSTNPFMKPLQNIIVPIFKESLPQLLKEYQELVLKANKRLDDMVNAS